MISDLRIRKSLTALTGTDQRKGYFYCLKMLGILPPPPKSGFDKWEFITAIEQNYTPKSLHDVLIAAHATSCEHHSFYFSFFHRHLMILTEIFLNFAHQVLKKGQSKLKQVYPPSQYGFLYDESKEKLWTDVFAYYNHLQNIPEHVANHYWNPTDYLSDSDLTLPDELKPSPNLNYENDPINILYKAINQAYPWQLHVPRRWSNNSTTITRDPKTPAQDFGLFVQNQPTIPDIIDQPNKNVELQKDSELFKNGKLDPRLNPKVYEDDYKYITTGQGPDGKPVQQITSSKFLDLYGDYNSNQILYRNYQSFNEEVQNYPLNAINDAQSLANYGAKSKNLQYVSKDDLSKYPNLTPAIMTDYNVFIPHFQYAYALFGTQMKEYIEVPATGGEHSHDTMHDNLRQIFNDVSFSVTSLVFWPYHSWIDAQIEIKLRRNETPQEQKEKYDYLFTELNSKYIKPNSNVSNLHNVLSDTFDVQNEVTLELKNNKWSGDQPINPQSGGAYPILEWITPLIRQSYLLPQTPVQPPPIILGKTFSPAFYSRDLILTKNSIRYSYNFNEVYQGFYAPYYQDRYWFFDNIRGFNYNYNYQIGLNLNNYLDKQATNIPKYLLDIQNDVLYQKTISQQALRTAIRTSKQSAQGISSKDPEFQQTQALNIKKIFSSGIKLYASYSPKEKNGHNLVYLKLKNVLADIHNKLSPQELGVLEKYFQNGIFVYDIFIFGKERYSKTCHKCGGYKVVFAELDNHLRVRVPNIWKHIHIDSLNQVYFDSSLPDLKLKSVYDKLSLVDNHKFIDYKLVGGAEEITVDVVSDISAKEGNKFIRIDAHSFSTAKDTIKSVLSKKYYSFKQNFDFFKIHDVDNNGQQLYFDNYSYKTLKGWVSVGNQREKFEVHIPNYQRLLRLTLNISLVGKKLHVRLVDKDFQAKLTYYEVASRLYQ